MATINPVQISAESGLNLVLWETLTDVDTAASLSTNGTVPIISAVQVVGSFGGAAVTMQGSNDGVNWINLKDVDGSAISLTAEGGAEFSCAYRFMRPNASGGSSQDVDIYLCMRG